MFLSLTFLPRQNREITTGFPSPGPGLGSPWELWAQPALPEAAPCSHPLLRPPLQSLTFPFSRGKSLVHPPRVIVKLLWLVF